MRKRGWGTLLEPRGGGPSSLLTSLVAYWKLEEASGTRVDATGRGNNAAVITIDPGNAAGKVGNAVAMSNVSDKSLGLNDNTDLSTGDIDFTLAAWVYLNSNVNGVIMAKYQLSGNQREYLLYYNHSDHVPSDRFSFTVSSNGTDVTTLDATTFGAPSLATWYLVVAWHDSVNNTLNIQINNGTVDSTAHAAGAFDSTAAFRLGTLLNGATAIYLIDGRIDEAGFWKRVLTSDERTALYNGGSGRTYPFTGT